jgi:hypothetical protein
MAVVSRDYNAFRAKLKELLPEDWWWKLYDDSLRHAWDHTIPTATQPEARGVEGLCREARELQRQFYGDGMGLHLAMMDWAERYDAAAPAVPGVRVDEAMVGDVRADIMRSAANDGCPIVIKDAWVREALTAALAGKEST